VSALKICPTCSTEYPANERFCPRDGTALRAQSGTDLVGTIIAERYHILKKLGEGGMGQVYLAEHVKMGRKSAVKVMNPSMVHDAGAIGRFNREAANASRINHPNVAGIYDFGETPDGLVYLAMEFIEGETLTSIVERTGALPAMRAAEITRQVAEALHVAHDMGIVHRDLKPDNVMITKDRDGLDCVKVVDFGIAKASDSESQKVTRTGMIVGTPEYMSPEQLAGEKLDGRSDLYSLALVAFNMLTGRLPFSGDTPQASMIMRLTDRPKSLVEMKPDTSWPPEVQAVMDRALERDVNLRYARAREFGRELYAAIQGMPRTSLASDGTLVMNTPAGARPGPQSTAAGPPKTATSVANAAPPPASPNTTATPPTLVVPKSRTPMFVGGGALVAIVVAAVVLLPHKTAKETGPGTTSQSTPAVQGAPTSPAATPASPAATVSNPPAGTTANTADASAAVAKELNTAFDHAGKESTARRALTEANQLSAKVSSPEEKAQLALVRVLAHGTLGEDSKACQTLREAAPQAKGTAYEFRLAQMLRSCQ
jgi:eukaryotic-like serine/threonine-protein kinase